jgi:hypothetical protein
LFIAGTARTSFYLWNDEDDLVALIRAHRAEPILGINY